MALAKVPAKRARTLGEHNEEVLKQLGFSATEIDGLHASGAVPKAKEREAAAVDRLLPNRVRKPSTISRRFRTELKRSQRSHEA